MESVYTDKTDMVDKTDKTDKKRCFGCGACRNACPLGAIAMKPDDRGSLYPSIDRQKCVDPGRDHRICRNCLAVCPMHRPEAAESGEEPIRYAVGCSGRQASGHSATEAAFIAISDAILKTGGIVYGADLGRNASPRYRRIATPEALDDLRQPKYELSATDEAYDRAIRDLREGRTVLFTGTACQTAGMRGLLRRKAYSANLYLCDAACGSASGKLLRPSCSRCTFADGQAASDLTVADFSAVEGDLPAFRDAGAALLLTANSPKGEALLEAARKSFTLCERVPYEASPGHDLFDRLVV